MIRTLLISSTTIFPTNKNIKAKEKHVSLHYIFTPSVQVELKEKLNKNARIFSIQCVTSRTGCQAIIPVILIKYLKYPIKEYPAYNKLMPQALIEFDIHANDTITIIIGDLT